MANPKSQNLTLKSRLKCTLGLPFEKYVVVANTSEMSRFSSDISEESQNVKECVKD